MAVELALLTAVILSLVLRKTTPSSHIETVSTSTPIKQVKKKPGIPVRLKIPKIQVNAPIELVGLTSDKDMGVPTGPKTVGWYRFGPRPGEVGSAVLDGHFGPWKNGDRSVFENLNKLKKGDKIYTVDKKGLVTTFIVRGNRQYDPEADATNVFRSKDGLAHLNLITCNGTWNRDSKKYSNRLVVFADKKK